MKNFFRSNMFYAILSVIIAILLWVYVVYDVRPTYEMTIEDVPVVCTNVSELFDSGSIAIVGNNDHILTEGITVDVKIKGKRSTVSTIRPTDISCTLDFITVNKEGSYNLKPNVEIDRSGVEIVSFSKANIKFKVETIEQKDIEIQLKTTGSLPSGYDIENQECKNTIVKITGPKSTISAIASAQVVLDYSSLNVYDTEKSLEIVFFDENGRVAEDSGINKSVGYAKVTFRLSTTKVVRVKLMPRYKDDVRKNESGRTVILTPQYKGASYEDGVELEVKLKGTAAALEKYENDTCTVYTTPIDVQHIYTDKIIADVKAAPLSSDVDYVEAPIIEVKAAVKE